MQSKFPITGDHESRPNGKSFFHFWRCFWLSFLVISLAYAWYCYYVPSNRVAWAESYASAQTKAIQTGKPILLYFTGEWCVPCRIMKRNVWADEQVAASVNAEFIPVEIDVDDPDDAAVLARYNIVGSPVTIVTDPEGSVLRWREGGLEKSEFLEFLKASNSFVSEDS
ncbi:thioredoxin family protein [Stieleria sp. ICT_E10.1]|uniref:thioredoxin family protein n=1 Tax=Stieleria sedimenti TaxID=2976331 RepID=UPI00217F4A5D|nr:thioredoxin family protein [Stieleria sedimenti]MCS7468933.1 thioredoxin family protein [Stieleria sedimenti]